MAYSFVFVYLILNTKLHYWLSSKLSIFIFLSIEKMPVFLLQIWHLNLPFLYCFVQGFYLLSYCFVEFFASLESPIYILDFPYKRDLQILYHNYFIQTENLIAQKNEHLPLDTKKLHSGFIILSLHSRIANSWVDLSIGDTHCLSNTQTFIDKL